MKKARALKMAVVAVGLVLLLALSAFALGPKMVDPHTAAWDPNTETDLAGYYVYYRVVTNPVTPWSDTRRSGSLAPSTTPRYDLLQLIAQNGQYEIMVTAFDNAGNESGPSNIVPFVLDLPGSPKNTRVQLP